MNIALVIESLEGGGAERVLARLALGLAARHRTAVYCLREAGVPLRPLRTAGVTVREAGSQGFDPWLPWQLGRWLRQDRIEIVHAHSCAALGAALPAAKLLRLPLVHVWHGWPLGAPTRHHRQAEWLTRFVDCVGINSESLRAKLPDVPPACAALCIPNGIDLAPEAADVARRRLDELCGEPLDGPVVLSVGNVRPEKDTCGLLAAMALLRRQVPEARLVHVGGVRDLGYWRQVQETTHALSLETSVHFLGPRTDAWRLMAGADVFCLSSRTESFPNVVLEAMSQRVPIVATAVGDVGALTVDAPIGQPLLRHEASGLLVPPGDVTALAEALACALRDRAAARQRAAWAWADYRRQFTTAQMVRGYERLYAEAVQRAGGRTRTRRCQPAHESPGSAMPHSAGGTGDGQRRPAVLMLGPAPPRIGGMVTSVNLLIAGPLRDRFTLRRFATTARDDACDDGTQEGARHRPHELPAACLRHVGALVRLAATIVCRRIDLVHIHTCSFFTFYRNLLDLAVAKLLGRPVLLHIRGGQFDQFCASQGHVGRRLIRHGLEAADAVIVLTRGWRERLRPYAGRARLLVVPNAVEIPVLRSGGGPLRCEPRSGATADTALTPEANLCDRHTASGGNGRPCRFLYLAALTEAKGLGDLLDAASRLRREGVAFRLVAAGPSGPNERAAWEQRVHDSGLDGVASIAGPVTGDAKTGLLAGADCFVHPSHSEGLPNAVLEAAAAGLPVIATAVGSVPELMPGRNDGGPAVPLVPPHDPAALAAQMRRLATDADLRRQIAQPLHQRIATQYSLTRVSQRMARVYAAILAWRLSRGREAARRERRGSSTPQAPRPVETAAPSGRWEGQVRPERVGVR